ncbi:HAT family dimerization domain containing protein [Trifolium pratense]|uniref:HAT family dimerization domain containing protein n=1 Tax=Trifolium pratense TaxID=57577 RepID=A0A2K3NVF1_TRIPR|nr:HAT family dimerization domain containing protein [Trifolium pratense]
MVWPSLLPTALGRVSVFLLHHKMTEGVLSSFTVHLLLAKQHSYTTASTILHLFCSPWIRSIHVDINIKGDNRDADVGDGAKEKRKSQGELARKDMYKRGLTRAKQTTINGAYKKDITEDAYRKRITTLKFFVYSPKGTIFLKFIDASDITKTANKVFKMIDDVVEEVGEENVVQIVTNNAANYKAAGELLMNKRIKLFWTPCAAHCIDLMLEDFEKKISLHKETIAKVLRIVDSEEKTFMGYLYEEMDLGKEKNKSNFNGVVTR